MSPFSLHFKTRSSNATWVSRSARLGLIAGSLISILLSSLHSAELVPNSRRVDWSAGVAVGVPGGIEQYVASRTSLIDVTASPYNADKTGSNDATASINSAISKATAGQVVYIPEGIYKIGGQIATGYKDNITIRGAGAKTILKATGPGTALYIGGESDYRWDYPNLPITVDLPKGSSTIPLSSTSAFTVGDIISISIRNSTDPKLPIVSVSGFERSRTQKSRVVSKTTTSITIFPELHYDMPVALAPMIARSRNVAEFVGVEDLVIDFSDSTAPFGAKMKQAYACWFLNVKITDVTNRHLYVSDAVQCEFRRSEFLRRRGDGSNGAGLLFQSSSACLIEDNIVASVCSLIQINSGASGNVFAYNFLYDSTLTGVSGPALKTNHGPHNSFNLFEGNISPNVQSDGYFGSASDDTFFRNWFHGTNPNGVKGWTVSLNRLTRNYSLIGNIIGSLGMNDGGYSFGNPNMGNSSFSGEAQPSNGTWWKDLILTATIISRIDASSAIVRLTPGASNPVGSLGVYWDDNIGSRANFTVKPVTSDTYSLTGGSGTALPDIGTEIRFWRGPNGFQEKDLDVESTTILKGNYIVKGSSASIAPSEALTEPLPESLFRSSKPSWFGELPWPVMNSISPSPTFESIPAGYRFMRGNNPEPSPSSKPSNVRVKITS